MFHRRPRQLHTKLGFASISVITVLVPVLTFRNSLSLRVVFCFGKEASRNYYLPQEVLKAV